MRANHPLRVVLLAAFIAVSARSATAQYPLTANTGLYKGERVETEADRGDPSNSQRAMGYVEETTESPLGKGYGPRLNNPNLFCPPDNLNCNESNAMPTPVPRDRISTVNAFSPMEGFHSTMNSMAYANQAATLLVSPLSVMKIAWALTEPGIGLGTDTAMTQANMWLQNRYLSDQAYTNHLRLSPNGEVLLKTYRDCISKHMRATDPGLYGPPAPRGVSWIQAVSLCQGGDAISNTTSEAFSTVEDNGFTLMDNLDHPGMGVSPQPNEISLVDMLFGDTGVSADMAELRTSFLRVVGNVTISIGTGQTGARAVRTSRVPPLDSPDKTFKDMTLEAYNTVHELLWRNCKYSFNHEYPGGTFGGMFGGFGQFYRAQTVVNLLERLSVRGYIVGQRTSESLFGVYRRLVLSQATPQCDELKSWEDNQPTSLRSLGAGGRWAANSTELSRVTFAFAKGLGLARFLGTLIQAQNVVNDLVGGEFSSLLKREAFAAIAEVAGASDLEGAYESNLRYLAQIEDRIIRASKANESDFKNQQASR